MPYPHSYIKLTPQERTRITTEITRLFVAGEIITCKRLQAIFLSCNGYTYSQIGRSLDVSYLSIKRWVSIYRKEGLAGLLRYP